MKIAVVILNWNGKSFLERFLPNVLAFSSQEAEVIIADNASTDGSIEWLESQHPGIRVIQHERNHGFATGYNLALRQIEADYYILLNSDIEVSPDWIMPVIRVMESDPRIAAAQPKLRSWHERHMFEYAGAAGGFIDKYGYPFCRGRIFMSLEEDKGQYDDMIDIFWATGACMFVRADVYHKLGGLDDDFFAHMEEIDFCWRLKNAGYRVMYCPDSLVYHIGGGTLPKSSSRKTYLNFRNNFSLLYKNLPSGQLFRVFSIRLILDAVAGLRFLIDSGWGDFAAVIKAHLSFYRSLPQLRKKRRAVHPKEVGQIYQRSIVFDHYLKRRSRFSELDNQAYRDPDQDLVK